MLIIAFWIRPKPLLGVLLPLLKYNTKPKSVSTTIYLRSTPAYAGKTLGKKTGQSACRDHPRLRGKDATICGFKVHITGSPPLARERLLHWDAQGAHDGITPACAGKTSMSWAGTGGVKDHPRLRGKDA